MKSDDQPSLLSGQQWPTIFLADHHPVRLSKSSRRMRRKAYRMRKLLVKIQNSQRRRKQRAERHLLRSEVTCLLRAKRLPKARVRNKDEVAWVELPRDQYFASYLRQGSMVRVPKGVVKTILDYKPVQRLKPPRNTTTIKSLRTNALTASLYADASAINQWAYRPPSIWAVRAIDRVYPVTSKFTDIVGFDNGAADKALQKAMARVNEAEINANEYIVEFRQVLNLLRDPVRTILSLHKVLERWTRRDAWMYIPARSRRRFGNGVLVSRAAPGAVLMSMRTKRTISVLDASSAMVNAAANRWLQYRYGIAPLVLDVTKVISLWAGDGTYSEPLPSKTARHVVSRSHRSLTADELESPFTVTYIHKWQKGEHYTAKQWFTLKHEVPWLARWNLHPTQWASVFWNALPWSFVADWVVNVDQWLVSTQYPPWIELGANVVTVKRYEKVRVAAVKARYGNYPATITGYPLAIRYYEAIRREIDLPRVTGPVLSKAWQSVKNAGTALALMITNFKHQRR